MTCSLVVVNKVAFPADKMCWNSTRITNANREGRNRFQRKWCCLPAAAEVSLGDWSPHPAHTDRGVVAVLDPDFSQNRMGAKLPESLQEFGLYSNGKR